MEVFKKPIQIIYYDFAVFCFKLWLFECGSNVKQIRLS